MDLVIVSDIDIDFYDIVNIYVYEVYICVDKYPCVRGKNTWILR